MHGRETVKRSSREKRAVRENKRLFRIGLSFSTIVYNCPPILFIILANNCERTLMGGWLTYPNRCSDNPKTIEWVSLIRNFLTIAYLRHRRIPKYNLQDEKCEPCPLWILLFFYFFIFYFWNENIFALTNIWSSKHS